MAKAPKPASLPATEPVIASKVEDATPATTAWSYEIPGNMPYIVGTSRVVRLTVEPITFGRFVACINEARRAALRDKSDRPAKYLLRERMKAMLRAWAADGAAVPLDDAALMVMPIHIAKQAREGIDSASGGMPGKELTEGDGISSPILYQLAMPLRMSSGEGDALEFREIEIQARTLGDIEDVLAVDDPFERARVLLQTCAKPVDSPVPMQALPSWAVEQISVGDGLYIAEAIVRRFLD